MRVPMKKRTCQHCEPVVIGMAWERDGDRFLRTLLRNCKVCDADQVQPIHYVEADLPVCGYCLSQELQRKDAGDEPGLMCSECGSTNILNLFETANDDI